VQRQQILLVASDQFRIAVAAADLVVAHRSPIAGGGKLVQLVKALLVMRVRCVLKKEPGGLSARHRGEWTGRIAQQKSSRA
jgi:hypothetical protein